jgi:ubiquinone/menaquinone biosynthesis C-methylase UbiE
MIEITRNKVGKLENVKEIKAGDAKNLDFNDDFFDWVLCIGMLEYYPLKISEEILIDFKRVLKKGGKAIVDFPDKNNPEAHEFREKSESVKTQVFIYDLDVLKEMIRKTGFDILKTKKAGIEVQFLLKDYSL